MELTNEQNPQQISTPSEVNPPIELGKTSLLIRVKSKLLLIILVLHCDLFCGTIGLIKIRQTMIILIRTGNSKGGKYL